MLRRILQMKFPQLPTTTVCLCLIAGVTASTDIQSSDSLSATNPRTLDSSRLSISTSVNHKSLSSSLSESQDAALRALGIPVVVPSYIPSGFQADEAIVNLCIANAPVGACREGSSYTIVYRNYQLNTCILIAAVAGGLGGGVDDFEFQTQTPLLGNVLILFGDGDYGGGPSLNQTPTPRELASFPVASVPEKIQSMLNCRYLLDFV